MNNRARSSDLHRPSPARASAPPRRGKWAILVLLLVAAGCVYAWVQTRPRPWLQKFRVVATYPHDPEAYCQGLLLDEGVLHESTGLRGASSVRTVELASGRVLRKRELAPRFFGEGLALAGDELIQLSWQEHVAFRYDKRTLEPRGQFEYEGEGWGLAYDGVHLVMSDGSDALVFRDPKTFAEVRRVHVRAQGKPLAQLNELEVVDGEIWANVWTQEFIARVDPATGNVQGIVDLRGLFDRRVIAHPDAVLNGIAYDAKAKRLFVTGKLWPKLFEIEIVDG
ncbi:MAG TPA: glutaminyl-peptide cyclotransferase [Planctomycetota bacterium]|nr:glutaminyl-peptide cyclotransferase [Planctomycetota bacterium]